MSVAAVPNDLLAVVATWPEEWREHFAEREAIMAIDASHSYVPAILEAFKDVVRVAVLRTRPPVGEQGEEVGHADGAVAVEVAGAAVARPPTCQQRQQIGHADRAVAVEVGRTAGTTPSSPAE